MSSNAVGADRHPKVYYATQNPVRVNPVGFKMPKYRPWKEQLDNDLRHLISQGIDNVMNSRNRPQRKLEMSSQEALSLAQLTTAFYMYSFGMALAALVFLGERIK